MFSGVSDARERAAKAAGAPPERMGGTSAKGGKRMREFGSRRCLFRSIRPRRQRGQRDLPAAKPARFRKATVPSTLLRGRVLSSNVAIRAGLVRAHLGDDGVVRMSRRSSKSRTRILVFCLRAFRATCGWTAPASAIYSDLSLDAPAVVHCCPVGNIKSDHAEVAELADAPA